MFDTIAAADLAWIQGFNSGRFVSACVGDASTVNAAGTKIITGVFQSGLTVVFVLCAMFYLDWRLSLIVLLGAPLAIVNLSRQKKRIRQASGMTFQEAGHPQQPTDADVAGHARGQGLRPGGDRDHAASSDRPEASQISDEGHARAGLRSGRSGISGSAPASPERSSTADGRAYTGPSRSGTSWASSPPPCSWRSR